jgi:hypothetical protein
MSEAEISDVPNGTLSVVRSYIKIRSIKVRSHYCKLGKENSFRVMAAILFKA